MADPHIVGVAYTMFVLKEKSKKGPSDEGEGKRETKKKGLLTEPHASHLGKAFISAKTEAIRSRCSCPWVILRIHSVTSKGRWVTA